MPERYSSSSDWAAFGLLISAMCDSGKSSDGDTGAGFPRSDAEDLSRGARFIPGEVTLARRAGQKVEFVSSCSQNCWYWLMPNSSRIYHFDPTTYESIGRRNGREKKERTTGGFSYKGGAGPCPDCGNPHTSGGTIKS